LLFEKVGKVKEGRRFYACSACRDRKDCNFFQWEEDKVGPLAHRPTAINATQLLPDRFDDSILIPLKVSAVRLLAREAENQSKRPALSQKETCSR